MLLPGLPEVTPDQASAAIGAITGAGSPALLLATGAVVLARLVGFMIVAPFFGSMNIPMTSRVGIAVVLTAVITPYIASTATPGMLEAGLGLGFLLLLVNQALIGLMLGFVGAFVFFAIESAGRIIDTQRGDNMQSLVAPQSGERTSPSGQWLMMLALIILLVSGQHMLLLDAIIDSFTVFPATTSLDWIGDPINSRDHMSPVISEFMHLSGRSLEITLQIAAPAMLSLLLADVLLGIINRGAPQVNVFALSMVIKGPIGIGALFVAVTAIAMQIDGNLIPDILKGEDSLRHLAHLMRNSSAAG